MSINKYCQLVSAFVSQGGGDWNAPRFSDWTVTGTGGITVSAGSEVVEIDVAAGTTELALYHTAARLPVIIEGVGAGAAVGVGIGLPVGITYAGGEVGVEGFSLGEGIALPSGGIGSLIAGPKAHSVVVSPHDLVTASAEPRGRPSLTLLSLAGGTMSQYSIGVAIFADRPVLDAVDLAYSKAIALVYGMQFTVGTAISANVSAMVYPFVKIRESSLPCKGARYGMSVAPKK